MTDWQLSPDMYYCYAKCPPACRPACLPACLCTCLSACAYLPASFLACLPAACLTARVYVCLDACMHACTTCPCQPACLFDCVHTCLPSCRLTDKPACPNYMYACLLACLHVCLPASLPACLLAFLPAYMPAGSPTCVPACLRLACLRALSPCLICPALPYLPCRPCPPAWLSLLSWRPSKPKTMEITSQPYAPRPVLQLGSALSIITYMGLPEELCLIPKLCYSSPASSSNRWIASTSRLKPAFAMHSFASQGGSSFPARIITLRANTLPMSGLISASSVYTPTHPLPTGSELSKDPGRVAL